MASLDTFLEEALAKSFHDRDWNCALMVATWVERATGIDPAGPWRGRFTTRLGWLRILKREGGLVAVMAKGAALAGLTETNEPKRGDVGVVRQRGGVDTACICLGSRWAFTDARGLGVRGGEPVKAWVVEPMT